MGTVHSLTKHPFWDGGVKDMMSETESDIILSEFLGLSDLHLYQVLVSFIVLHYRLLFRGIYNTRHTIVSLRMI